MFGNGFQQLLLFQPLLGEEAIGIPVCAIAQDGDNGVAWAHLLSNLLGGGDVEGARGTEIKAFLVEASVDHVDTVCVGNVDRVVEEVDIGFQVVRHATLTNSLGDTTASSFF